MSITHFWYHSNGTKRNPWVMLSLQWPIKDSSGYFNATVHDQASRHTAESKRGKRFIYQVMMNCKTFKTPTLLGMGPRVSHWWGRVAEISSFQFFFENNRSIVFLTIGLLFIQLKFFCHIYVCRKSWFPKKEVMEDAIINLEIGCILLSKWRG